jgi:phosphoribosyl 1,2-cyclic phosphodiesterase
MEIKKALNWNIKDVVGVLCTHQHSDHNKSLKDFINMGIPVFAPYLSLESMKMETEFNIRMFDLTTIDGNWTHTDANGEPCPIYGFLITHKEMGRMLYITDCEVVKWKFRDINHILLGVNYDKDLIDRDNTGKANHVFRGHLSIDTACDFVKANYSDSLQNVIMCHLSSENSDRDSFIEKMKKVARGANVDVAERNKEWLLVNPNECPF